jgi:catechol 2,3-dioxygenase-like lactoylglutathione lyase family enzyme
LNRARRLRGRDAEEARTAARCEPAGRRRAEGKSWWAHNKISGYEANMQKKNLDVKRPRITGLSGMAFQAHDIEKSLAFYKDLLGYEDLLRQNGRDGSLERVFIKINDAQYVELQPEREPMTDRLIQFGFEVEDAEALRTYLAASGIVVPAATSLGPTGNPSFHVKDPDGHSVEFIQYIPAGWPRRDSAKKPGANRVSTCLMHTGFTVRSLDKAMAFYRDTLGFTELWRGSRDNQKLSWVQLRLPDDRNYIEFMLHDGPPTLDEFGRWNHFGLEVPSIPASVEALAKRPAFSMYSRTLEHTIGVCRHRLSNLFDPDGTRAELMERATFDGSVTPSSAAPPPS